MDTSSIRVWQSDIVASAKVDPDLWDILSLAEQRHAQAINNLDHRQRYVEIHARLRTLLAEVINGQPKKLEILKGEYGKPYLADYPELAFNLSHTAHKYVIVIGFNLELGVDVETCKPRNTLPGLVEKCFAREEQDYWRQLPEQEKIKNFYRFWTRKEAFVKAVGRGIALGLNQCVINPDNPNRFLRLPIGYGQPDSWHIQEIDVGNGYCAAFAARPLIH